MSGQQRRSPRLAATPLAQHNRFIVRELALGLRTRAEIARQFGVTKGAVTRFAQRNAREIDELRAAIGDEVREQLAGMWIASQEHRIRLYQTIAETDPDNKSVIAALKAVAEELGQLPPRAQVVVMPVTHIVEGVDMDALR